MRLLRGTGVLAFVAFGAFMWDYNQAGYDQKAERALLYDMIRVYAETHDPGAMAAAYVGSTRTKIFHRFTSDCALKIRSTELRGFDTTQDAAAAGYSPCSLCVH